MIIWILANVKYDGESILQCITEMLDPLGELMGLDGVILTGFILALPANEIVMPIIIMTYLAQGNLTELGSQGEVMGILLQNGWNKGTALCTIVFSLMHWPCSTTLLTIKKETGSWKWSGLAILIPTLAGLIFCIAIASCIRLFS